MNREVTPIGRYVRFYMLGTPYVKWGDRPIEIPRRQVRHLLYLLAINTEPVSKEVLRYYFWPDVIDGQSCRYLTHLIFHARKTLPSKQMLLNSSCQVCLDRNLVWCDVDSLRSLEHINQINDQNTAEMVQATVSLYRGTLLKGLEPLDSLEFENEIDNHRWHLERIYLNQLHNLIVWETKQGHYHSALEYANQYVLVDDMCEEIHQHIVSLYALLGNRNKAVEQFRSCKQVLDRELNLQPSPETEKIYQDALEGRIHSHFKGVQPHAPRREDVEKGKFVGREDSWENLIRWAEGIQWGVGGVVLVHGEQGVGKTRLVKEAMSSLGEDTLILWANCYPGSQSVPLQPIIQLFHNINKHSSRFPRFPDEKLEGIFRFPLKDFQEQPKADGSHYEMVRFSKVHYYFLVIEFFLELAETCSPVIICLEDINFADAETIEFLNYFATLIRREKILVILTYCCVVSAQLKQYLNHQHLMSSFRGAIQLSGLDDKDIASLVSRFSEDRPVSQDLINHLRKVTGGNPLFLIELLELVHRSGMPFDSLSKPGGFPLPPTVEKVIKLRLDQLERPQRDLLSMAAFIGIRFSYERLRQSSDLPTERLLDHLDDLVSRHFLVDEGEHYRFRHGLLHSVVINSLSAARIRELKRCVKME